MDRQEIENIIYLNITGAASEKERQQLNEWLEADERNQAFYNRLINTENISSLYQLHHDVDVEKAWLKFAEKQNIGAESKEPRAKANVLSFLKYAAAILVLLVAGVGIWYSQYTKVTPPEIPEAVQLAMQQSIESGKQEAESEELRVKSEESELSEELRVKSEESFESEELRVKSEEYLGKDGWKKYKVESPANNSSLFTLHSSLNITSSLTKDQLLAAKRITTRHDKEFWLTLDDGTLVHLNYNTRLIYPEKFGRGDRNVILDGEAYFMVAKDRSRPFVVHTLHGDIKVYGTEFNVNTNAASTTVVLVKGSVGLTSSKGIELILEPGQLGEMKTNELELVDKNVETDIYTSWNEGKYIFRDCRLDKLMQILSHWYGVQVTFENQKACSIPFTGNINKYKSISPALHAIEFATGLTITMKDNHVVIK